MRFADLHSPLRRVVTGDFSTPLRFVNLPSQFRLVWLLTSPLSSISCGDW